MLIDQQNNNLLTSNSPLGVRGGSKYFLIAGEASGDLHASNLMREIKNLDTEAEFCFLGGDLMQVQGG